ncbi:MAG: hypothetical protein DA408_05795 [Bacteroidetes bacterium]|nr:MAG: hypothetical protein C7N36_08745 [Bacteroidota bacterium]PTM13645.1 MAG: hypothetical protein DA408_05795 [Bacteroidota bacterium]
MRNPSLIFYCCLLLVVLLSNCQAEAPIDQANNNLPVFLGKKRTTLTNVTAYARPHEEPLAQLPPGTQLLFTGLVSSRLYTSYYQQDTLTQPYLQIQLSPQQTAWVFGHPAYFSVQENPLTWQWNNRLQAVMPTEAFNRYQELATVWRQEDQASVLLLAFQATRSLRNELTKALADYPTLSLTEAQDLLPGCLAYQDHRHLSWWIDFNAWQTRSAATAAPDDDALFHFYRTRIYPPDGIEYRFPAWSFPVSSTQAHSLLGRGIHLRILQQLDSLNQQYPLATTEWQYLCELLVDDSANPQTTFWEDFPLIRTELQALIKFPGTLLLPEQRRYLAHCLENLANPAQQSKRVNFRER